MAQSLSFSQTAGMQTPGVQQYSVVAQSAGPWQVFCAAVSADECSSCKTEAASFSAKLCAPDTDIRTKEINPKNFINPPVWLANLVSSAKERKDSPRPEHKWQKLACKMGRGVPN
jgi:hypothetical protein